MTPDTLAVRDTLARQRVTMQASHDVHISLSRVLRPMSCACTYKQLQQPSALSGLRLSDPMLIHCHPPAMRPVASPAADTVKHDRLQLSDLVHSRDRMSLSAAHANDN